jgi:LPS export ABC transporter protein LptC
VVYKAKNRLMTKQYLLLLVVLSTWACHKTDTLSNNREYKGPDLILKGINLSYSDSTQVKVRLITALELDLHNQDRLYPKKVNLYFYDEAGSETTTIESDSGHYYKTANEYKLMGNVLITDKIKNQTMNTTSLIWAPTREIIYTTDPVDLTTPTQILHGQGLTANQNFTQYSLGKVSGTIVVPE